MPIVVVAVVISSSKQQQQQQPSEPSSKNAKRSSLFMNLASRFIGLDTEPTLFGYMYARMLSCMRYQNDCDRRAGRILSMVSLKGLLAYLLSLTEVLGVLK